MTATTSCQPLQPGMLPNPVEISVAGPLNREAAFSLALSQARQMHPEVMLLAWFERASGEYSPQVTCCREDKPAWLVYALSRGADLFLSLNGGEFVLAYKKL